MIRTKSPYDGRRYLANLSTNEIHDLQNETPQCQIDEIVDFVMGESYEQCCFAIGLLSTSNQNVNGCYYCLNSKHTD